VTKFLRGTMIYLLSSPICCLGKSGSLWLSVWPNWWANNFPILASYSLIACYFLVHIDYAPSKSVDQVSICGYWKAHHLETLHCQLCGSFNCWNFVIKLMEIGLLVQSVHHRTFLNIFFSSETVVLDSFQRGWFRPWLSQPGQFVLILWSGLTSIYGY